MSERLGPAVVLAATAMLVLVPLPADTASAHHYEDSPIQPGAEIDHPGLCSFNFVYEDQAGDLYIGTAGHCVDEGQYVIPADFDRAIGTVVWDAYDDGLDFALVSIDADLYDLVEPSVRHWGGPTGVATQQDTSAGDVLLHYGNGVYFRESELLRPRTAALVDHTEERYCAMAGIYGGDSGSGILTADGKALGVNVRLGLGCTPPTSLEGPTVSHVLDRAEQDAGLELDVVTVDGLKDPVERETQRVQHLP